MFDALPYRTIVVADFEFEFGGHDSFAAASRSGERPRPVCMVARELRSGQTWRLWRDEFGPAPPFPIGSDALFVAFYAPSSAVSAPWVGRSQPMFSTCLPNFAIVRTDWKRRPAPAWSAR
jgi:hypothetical protein